MVFGKVDTEAEQQLAGAANITSIPTLMAFRDGILVFSQPGALPPQALEQVIQGVKGLDMDEVRSQIAAQQDGYSAAGLSRLGIGPWTQRPGTSATPPASGCGRVGPNQFVAGGARATCRPGRAVDLAAGEGRNAVWLAERGWDGDRRGLLPRRHSSAAAAERAPDVPTSTWVHADVLTWQSGAAPYDLAVLAYLQLEPSRAAAGGADRVRLPAPGRHLLPGRARHAATSPRAPADRRTPRC